MMVIATTTIVTQFHLGSRTVYIIPPGGYEDEKLFDLGSPRLNRDNCIRHFYDLHVAFKKLGYTLKTARLSDNMADGEYILTSGITPQMVERLRSYPREKLTAHIWEPTSVEFCSYDRYFHDFFSKIFIMDDSFVDGKKYIKLFYPHPSIKMIEKIVPFEKKNFCTLISSNKTSGYAHELYSERERAIQWFEVHDHGFDFYGKGWREKGYLNYKGEVFRKLDVLRNYKFCICFENTGNMDGYITEKIFDSFEAGCVPVYLGAPNITTYIPKTCFIDFRDFHNYDKLFSYLASMTKNKYEEYIVNIRNFLQSPAAYRFSIAYFVHTTLNSLIPNYDMPKVFSSDELDKLRNITGENAGGAR